MNLHFTDSKNSKNLRQITRPKNPSFSHYVNHLTSFFVGFFCYEPEFVQLDKLDKAKNIFLKLSIEYYK